MTFWTWAHLDILEKDELALPISRETPQMKVNALPKPGDVISNSLGMKFAWVPPSTFLMGSEKNEPGRSDDELQRKATLTKGCYMGVYTVTQEEWQAVTGSNPSYFKSETSLPVEMVKWDDC